MTAGERFKEWVDKTASSFADRLKGWVSGVLSWGLEIVMDVIAKSAAPKLKPMIDRIEKETEIPPELKPLFDELREPTGEFGALLANSAGSALVGGAIGKILDFMLRPITLAFSYVAGYVLLNAPQLLALWRRGKITEDELNGRLHQLGLGGDTIPELKSLLDTRLDPTAWITAFRRDYEDWDKIKDDLKHQGWTDDRIKALKFITLYMPSAAEIVHWYAREVYEPDMIDRYGLDSELPAYEQTDFPKIGVDSVQAKHHWMAHWEHASYMQVREMIHRGVLSLDKTMPTPPTTKAGWAARDAEGEKAAYDWYRLVEIPPFWRARLTEMMYEVPTRVDVRRFWDMRTISEGRLRDIYHAQGYHGKDLDDYILWTKVYTAFPDLVARFKNGWISEEDAKSELAATGLEEPRLTELWETKFKSAKPERVSGERDLTKTDIYRGVKKEVINWEQGLELLQDMGYDEDEAEYILQINVGAIEGSPETYAEFKQWTQLYRRAQGLEAKLLPPELIEASRAVAKAKIELNKAEEKGLKNEKLAPYLKAMSDAEYRYRQLLVKWEAETK